MSARPHGTAWVSALIAGPRHFTDYPARRAALDALRVNRLPGVIRESRRIPRTKPARLAKRS
jgi:hypothetical protein